MRSIQSEEEEEGLRSELRAKEPSRRPRRSKRFKRGGQGLLQRLPSLPPVLFWLAAWVATHLGVHRSCFVICRAHCGFDL